ncbi:MAG: hypothetical protein FWE27_01770 [Defluviitaleaceae bacterium]|nr:hypothetical protein [Defluviitaleaceae bacterium]
MLKRFLTMFAMLFTVSTITGCIQYRSESTSNTEPVTSSHAEDVSQYSEPIYSSSRINHLSFASLDEFLDVYVSAREGRDSSDLNTAAIMRNIDFVSLDTIHLLANIPEEFHIAAIHVHETAISIWYIPIAEEVTWETWSNAFSNHQYFELLVIRLTNEDLESWEDNSPMDGIMRQTGSTENDLIDGKYLFCERTRKLSWMQGSNRFMLRLPILTHENNDSSGLTAEELGIVTEMSVRDMLKFAKTVAVDLQNENNIAAWSAGDFTMIEEMLQYEIITTTEFE